MTRRLHHQMRNAAMLRATTPPITPPATATVDCTEPPFELGTMLTAELLVGDVLVASGNALPLVGTGATSGKAGSGEGAGEGAAWSGTAAGESFAAISEAAGAVTLLSVGLVS